MWETTVRDVAADRHAVPAAWIATHDAVQVPGAHDDGAPAGCSRGFEQLGQRAAEVFRGHGVGRADRAAVAKDSAGLAGLVIVVIARLLPPS